MEKIAIEVAEAEYLRMCEFFDIDTDTSDLNEESLEDFERLKNKVVKAICGNSLTISEDGTPSYTTKKGVTLTFKEPNGATLLVKPPGKGVADEMRKMFAILAELTGGKVTPAALSIRDTGVLMAIINLFISELQ